MPITSVTSDPVALTLTVVADYPVPVERLWEAYSDPRQLGERYRYEWEAADGSQRFGFEGELLESAAPYRAVTSEAMIGMDGPGTRNEMTLVAVPGGTLLSLVVTYPSREVRDMVLGTGMTAGMEASYARLERDVLAA